MRNVVVTVKGDDVILTLPGVLKAGASKTAPPSASKLTRVLATTSGNVGVAAVDGHSVKLGLNLYCDNPDATDADREAAKAKRGK